MRLHLTIDAGDAATASRQAQALERIILEEGPAATIERIRTRQDTLDGGATLAVILASPVLLELARCLHMFLQRYNSSQVTITDERGSLVARNVSASTVMALTREWSTRRDAS